MGTLQTFTKDGVPLKIGQIPQPEKMFFYERFDGSVFNVGERNAAKTHAKFKYLGMTDGMHYMNAILELQKNAGKLTLNKVQIAMRKAWAEELELAKKNLTTIPQLPHLNLNMQQQVYPKSFRDEIR